MMQVSIRLATLRDAAPIAAMSRDFIEHGLGWSWTPRRVAYGIGERETNAIVAEVGDALAGFGLMKYRDADAHLLLLGVQPAFRRRGVGGALMDWLENTASTAGLELIWLEARADNAGAIAFYRARGYRTLDVIRRYYRGSDDAVRIGKDLSEARPSPTPDR